MTTPLVPQEIFLLERFCSLERYGEMRDAWHAMLSEAEDFLARFMRNLPPEYRKRPLQQQPDIVWGERVLPNFRETMHILNDGYIKLSHGNYGALSVANGVTGDVRGQTMDYSAAWMDEVEAGAEARHYKLLCKANDLAWPIMRTSSAIWSPGSLTTNYDEVIGEPLNPPPTWPTYRLNRQVTVRSGDRVSQTGIYLPDVDHGFPTLLIKSDDPLLGEANEALVMIDPSTSTKREYRPALWTLVERVANESEILTALSLTAPPRQRSEGGQPCPQSGYWFTPAKLHSRRYFKEGEIMPVMSSDYGSTIWQWDPNQPA
ncbi:hypothetical protein [Noviherbaspirillum sp.]|mgnify:CR=1 FL=1|jgi:hypothetical protein|uniref:hypothetical protein n=1 Tax=Noviherbaspirillum sp. TaxID=1926288 RepID=UPI0025E99841|nr:hypothetical protein [Noviherbaspirillum sp.]